MKPSAAATVSNFQSGATDSSSSVCRRFVVTVLVGVKTDLYLNGTARAIRFPSILSFCPTCGRELPVEVRSEPTVASLGEELDGDMRLIDVEGRSESEGWTAVFRCRKRRRANLWGRSTETSTSLVVIAWRLALSTVARVNWITEFPAQFLRGLCGHKNVKLTYIPPSILVEILLVCAVFGTTQSLQRDSKGA